MKILTIIKDYFLVGVIIILLILLLIGRCSKPTIVEVPTIVKDTIWMHHDSVIQSKPKLINTIITDTIYIPDGNYEKLLEQHQQLLKLFFSKNIMKDTIKVNNFGYISTIDTITKNLISKRIYNYQLKYPEITNNITTIKNKNQLYVGGGLSGNPNSIINQINAGIILKNKKDQLFGIYTGINSNGQVQYGINSYFKIKIK